MKIQIVDVHLMGNDVVICATETQAKKLVAMNNDPDLRTKLIKIGPYTFRPSSVAYMLDRKEEDYALPSYLIENKKRENGGLIEA